MPAGPTDRPSRARPVADAPVAALVDAAEDLAKGWLLELVAAGPLDAAAALPLAELAREGPPLCAAAALALRDDADLARLAPGGDLAPLAARAGALAGAADPPSAVAAVDALRRVLWSAALAELPRAPGTLVADLADRLAAISSTLVAAALKPRHAAPATPPAGEPAASPPGSPVTGARVAEAHDADGRFAGVAAAGAEPQGAPDAFADAVAADRGPADDEPEAGPDGFAPAAEAGADLDRSSAARATQRFSREPEEPGRKDGEPVEGRSPGAAGRARQVAGSWFGRRGRDVEQLAELARAVAEERVRVSDLRAERPPQIIRPPRGDEPLADGSPPRVADGDPRIHLAARAAEFAEDGRPFAVLLVELDGVEVLLAAERDDQVARAVDAAERALEDLARPGDAIRREAPGRLWLTLPGAGPAGARALALRAAAAVERAADHRGRPLTATVGVAVCPRDGTDADALVEHAEDNLLAAQAAGTHGGQPPAV